MKKLIKKWLEKRYQEQNELEKQIENDSVNIVFKKKKDYPFVSIVFPSWNGKKVTLECIESLRKLDYPKERMEIIISDNGSTDGSIDGIKNLYKKMKREKWHSLQLIENGENVGPAIAYNRGIKKAYKKYDYIWKLDNDVELDKKALIELIKVAESNEKIGFVGSKVFYNDDGKGRRDLLWHAGAYIEFYLGLSGHYGKDKYDDGSYDKIKICKYVVGCSYIVKRKVIDKIGLIDERYFIYGDDTDWCLSGNKAGFINIYNYKSKVYHKISPVVSKMISPFAALHTGKNAILLERKFARFYQWPSFFIYVCIIKNFNISVLKKNTNYFKGIIRGFKI
ncbi:MAG: glycosyltransferase family 2 protein [Candidatus Pacearchaeota archaeon]|jgi:hypothetical protein